MVGKIGGTYPGVPIEYEYRAPCSPIRYYCFLFLVIYSHLPTHPFIIFMFGFDFSFGFLNTHIDENIDINPPVDLYSQYYSEEVDHDNIAIPNDLINFNIALLTLAKSKNLDDHIGINYISKFLNSFCQDSNNYSKLSQEGKEQVDFIFNSSSPLIKNAVQHSNCSSSIVR